MRQRKTKPAQSTAGVTAAPSPPPDPIDVITDHWATMTGLTRKEAAAKLIQIGHCHMKANRAGINDVERELGILIGQQAVKQEERMHP